METLSHILASFDIFQVLVSAFPHIYNPILHAFQGMFTMLTEMAGKQFASHPGLILGTVIFLLVYVTWSGVLKLRRTVFATRTPSPTHSL